MKYLIAPLLLTGCASDPLSDLNQQVNGAIRYQTESGDVWDASCPTAGDCEDYALCKARKLLERGYARGRLAILVSDSPAHAVLLVDGMVLDNQKTWAYPLEGSGFKPSIGCRLDGKLDFYHEGKYLSTTKVIEAYPKCNKVIKEF